MCDDSLGKLPVVGWLLVDPVFVRLGQSCEVKHGSSALKSLRRLLLHCGLSCEPQLCHFLSQSSVACVPGMCRGMQSSPSATQNLNKQIRSIKPLVCAWPLAWSSLDSLSPSANLSACRTPRHFSSLQNLLAPLQAYVWIQTQHSQTTGQKQ